MSKAPGLDVFLEELLFPCKLQSTGSQSTTLDVEGLLLISLGKVNKENKLFIKKPEVTKQGSAHRKEN